MHAFAAGVSRTVRPPAPPGAAPRDGPYRLHRRCHRHHPAPAERRCGGLFWTLGCCVELRGVTRGVSLATDERGCARVRARAGPWFGARSPCAREPCRALRLAAGSKQRVLTALRRAAGLFLTSFVQGGPVATIWGFIIFFFCSVGLSACRGRRFAMPHCCVLMPAAARCCTRLRRRCARALRPRLRLLLRPRAAHALAPAPACTRAPQCSQWRRFRRATSSPAGRTRGLRWAAPTSGGRRVLAREREARRELRTC